MGWTAWLVTCWLAAAPPAEGPAAGGVTGSLPEPIATRRGVFSIPFRIDWDGHSAGEPIAVELYVSSDSGLSWHLAQKVQPRQARFVFNAPTDGEYWFAIRTRGASGEPYPERIDAPGLRVVVDRTAPELQIHAVAIESGLVNAQWEVTERFPDAATFRIQYRAGANGPWHEVPVDATQLEGPVRTGRVRWRPELPAGASGIEIRAELADAAGNRSVAHDQIRLPGPGQSPSLPSGLAHQPAGPGPTAPGGDPAQGAMGGRDDASSAPQRSPAETGGQSAGGLWRPAAESAPARSAEPGPPTPASVDEADPAAEQLAEASQAEQPASEPPTSVPITSPVNPPVADQVVPIGADDSPHAELALAAEAPLRVIASPQLQVQYDVAPEAGTGPFALWALRDPADRWICLAVDQDGESPVTADLAEEGLYGVRMEPARGDSPPEGQAPDFWVLADWTVPAATIVSAEVGTGQRAGKLVVRWTAQDPHLADRPISLFVQQERGGPWRVVASGLKNTGQFDWPLPADCSANLYVRLEARDLAGNLGVDETEEPIPVAGPRPLVQIRDVEPAPQAASKPNWPESWR